MAEASRRSRTKPPIQRAGPTAVRLTGATTEAFVDLSLSPQRVEEWGYQLRRVLRLNVMGVATWLALTAMDMEIVKRLTKWRAT